MVRKIARGVLTVASSLATCCVLLVLLGLLTWLGTLEQTRTGLFEVQRKYFESFILFHDFGRFSIPLPGANLVMCLLAVNLAVGGFVRIRKSWATAGVIVTHVGIAMLLMSALVKHNWSSDGHVTLYEGQSADHFESYFRWELAVIEQLDGGRVREHLVPHERIEEAQRIPVSLNAADIPFTVQIESVSKNCRPERAQSTSAHGPVVIDGVKLVPREVDARAEANIAGACVSIFDEQTGTRRRALLWGAEAQPFTFVAAGKAWAVSLRKERYAMPFAIQLARFNKTEHPGTNMPRSFESEVQVASGSSSRDVKISMNEPLRDGGLVLYQASWGPSNARPGDRLFSTFAVVRNPADQWPLAACLVIAAGLLFHFVRKLTRYVKLEMRAA
ncbi:MAG: cytochrome c biogenesis protein ResB [Planctomycetes bacterium]|nr:cytochrome c biogenesis protein ResB [Planctomycetota bacterium]